MKPSPDVICQEVEGELVMLDLADSQYYSLDRVGARVWSLLEEHDGDVERVISAMLTEFDVDETIVRCDVDALVAALAKAGLLVASPGAA